MSKVARARVTCTGSEWYERILRRALHRGFFVSDFSLRFVRIKHHL